MREPNAQISCRREQYGDICRWEGPPRGVALISHEVLRMAKDGELKETVKEGEVYKFDGLKVRIIQPFHYSAAGAMCDSAAVMLESPHAQLYQLYLEKAEGVVRFVRRCEMAVLAFRECLREGQQLTFTRKVADWLL